MKIHSLFNSSTVRNLVRYLQPVAAISGLLLLTSGLYLAFFASPPDYQQGDTVRIMYIHVPSAWMSLLCYGIVFSCAISYLVWRNPNADLLAEASTKIGSIFTLITLVTGSLWGKPMWGAYWVWDARLTSVLVLFFLYLGLLALRSSYENSEHGKKLSSVLAIVGVINLPIIKFSVDWWNTLHQPASVVRLAGPSIHSSMLLPLLVMFGAWLCYYIFVATKMIESAKLEKKLYRSNSGNYKANSNLE